ncbi:MAG: hypothetical protein NTV86_00735 [Planctomycetota bacterium]|nr:hypothetical protein [Planctomycetota bacterium]
MHEQVRTWIAEVLKAHPAVMAVAMRQRAKFEGWLKFELAARMGTSGVNDVAVESGYDGSLSRADICFAFQKRPYLLELKTPNTNFRTPGVEVKGRPLTKNLASITADAEKLRTGSGDGLMAFVLFPIPTGDSRWHEYLQRISKETGINVSPDGHCCRVAVSLGPGESCDAVVCCFPVAGR